MAEVYHRNLCSVTCASKTGFYCGGHTNYFLTNPRLGYFRCCTENCSKQCTSKGVALASAGGCIFSTTEFKHHGGISSSDNILTVLDDRQISLPEWLKIKGKEYFTTEEIAVGSRIDVLDRKGRYRRGRVVAIRQGHYEHLARVQYDRQDDDDEVSNTIIHMYQSIDNLGLSRLLYTCPFLS
jgi:hypothetical protein